MEFQRIQTSQSDATQEILKWVANFVLIFDCLMNSILKKDVFFFNKKSSVFFFLHTGSRNWFEQKAKWNRLHHWCPTKPVATRALPMPRVSELIFISNVPWLVCPHVCRWITTNLTWAVYKQRQDKRNWVELHVLRLHYRTWSECLQLIAELTSFPDSLPCAWEWD